MSAMAIGGIVFACVVGGSLVGFRVRRSLPDHHFNPDSRDVAKLATGLIATMAALVLGLLVASARDAYDAEKSALTQLSAHVVLLDRVLAHYGPETKEARDVLRAAVVGALEETWSTDGAGPPEAHPVRGSGFLVDTIQRLSPKDDVQRALRSQASSLAFGLAETRWLMFEQAATSVSMPLLITLVCWITILYVTFGLLAAPNTTLIAILCASALAVSGAVVLMLEMYTPYTGFIALSDAPLRVALSQLGQ